MIRTHTIGEINEGLIGKKVMICGWVDTIRSHGKIVFLDIRDRYGIVQTVISQKDKGFEKVKDLSLESSVAISGSVGARPKGTENDKISSGKVEIAIDDVEIFNKCPPLPFSLSEEGIDEEVRLKYRYLDLRRPKMQKNLILRHKVCKVVRDFFDKEGFIEIETPILAKSTPEGSRDYLVPSRVHPGKFYALPQSPQLFKQLLMVAGYDRYIQLARCMRDEDLRADRQPEFTQVDVEMSFITKEDIIDVIERLLKDVFKASLGIDIQIPFKRMTYAEAMEKYNSDKPDLRKETGEKFAFLWVIDFPAFEFSKEEGKHVSTHHPFTSPNIEDFMKEPLKARSEAYDVVLNGVEIGGGSIRIHNADVQQKVFDILQITPEEARKKFGFLLDALKFGAPPHGGIALGIDRILQIISDASSIREIIAFPKNKSAIDVMLDSPSDISEKQLKEAHIGIKLEGKVGSKVENIERKIGVVVEKIKEKVKESEKKVEKKVRKEGRKDEKSNENISEKSNNNERQGRV